jgi:hypothetical protein
MRKKIVWREKMKNTYLTGYLPLLSIILFSLSFSVYSEGLVVEGLKRIKLYDGMLEFITEVEMKLAILIVLFVVFFMLFAALKLIAETINELALLFFSKDAEGDILKAVRSGSIAYFIGGGLSIISLKFILGLGVIFLLTTIIYFIYFVYKISPSLSTQGLVGVIFFEVVIWSVMILSMGFIMLKLYNSLLGSLP